MKMGLRGGVYLFPRPVLPCAVTSKRLLHRQVQGGWKHGGFLAPTAVRSRLASHLEGHEWGNTFSLVGCQSRLKIILRVFFTGTAHSTFILPTHCFHFSFYKVLIGEKCQSYQ